MDSSILPDGLQFDPDGVEYCCQPLFLITISCVVGTVAIGSPTHTVTIGGSLAAYSITRR